MTGIQRDNTKHERLTNKCKIKDKKVKQAKICGIMSTVSKELIFFLVFYMSKSSKSSIHA